MRTLNGLMDLSGRKALVSGGAGHIGLAVGETLLELGATVSILDVDAASCQERVASFSQFGKGKTVALPCDLRDVPATRSAVRNSIARMSGLDILVHCAAYTGVTQTTGWAVPFEEQSVEAWDAAMKVNLTSAFVLVEGRMAIGRR